MISACGTIAEVAVCIASIGRQSIVETIRSILGRQPDHVKVKIIVADDSKEGVATRIIADVFGDDVHCGNIVVVQSRRQNIAEARNMCLDAVGSAQYVAFIDDDEYAAEGWIAAYLDEFNASQSDVLFGAVAAVYDAEVPKYIQASGLYSFNPADYEGRFVTGASSNVMMRKRILDGHTVRFLKEYGVTGGEDTVFFHELYKRGARLGGASRAIVYEKVSAARCDLAYLKQRYIRVGQTQSLLVASDRNVFREFAYLAVAVAKLVTLFGLCSIMKRVAERRYLDYLTRYWQNLGRIIYFFGSKMPELYKS